MHLDLLAFFILSTVHVLTASESASQLSAPSALNAKRSSGSIQQLVKPQHFTWTNFQTRGTWQSVATSADGKQVFACTGTGLLTTSYDYGNTWASFQYSGEYLISIVASADGSKVIFCSNTAPGNIYYSENNGASWRILTTLTNCVRVTISDDGTKMVASAKDGGSVIYSTDSGTSWIAITPATNGHWWGLDSTPDGSHLILGDYGGFLRKSSDSGATWQITYKGITGKWDSAVISSDGNTVIAVDRENYVVVSTNFGVDWKPPYIFKAWVATVSGDGSVLVCSLWDSGPLLMSVDAGDTWTVTKSGSQNYRDVATSRDGTVIYGAGEGGYIVRGIFTAPAVPTPAPTPAPALRPHTPKSSEDSTTAIVGVVLACIVGIAIYRCYVTRLEHISMDRRLADEEQEKENSAPLDAQVVAERVYHRRIYKKFTIREF